jgi:hypothetical protein
MITNKEMIKTIDVNPGSMIIKPVKPIRETPHIQPKEPLTMPPEEEPIRPDREKPTTVPKETPIRKPIRTPVKGL